MRKNKIVFFNSILFICLSGRLPLVGQTYHSISTFISVPPLQEIQVESNPSFPDIFVEDIKSGFIDIDRAVQLTVFSNVPWRIVVRTTSENLYVSSRRFKSVNDLKWRTGSEPYQAFTSVPSVVAQGEESVKNLIIEIDYRLMIGWKSTPPGRWEVDPEFRIEPLPGGF